jgi:PPM family protein phosphatase
MVFVESAGISDVGKKRKGNEDSLYLDDARGLYVVADGMGGHNAGEVASELVVETLREYMSRSGKDDRVGSAEGYDETLSAEANRLLAGIRLANRGVFEVAQSNEAYRGMGSTVSAAFFTDKTLIAANVGDSPIYLVHDNDIELISTTHNVVSEQAAIDPVAADRLGEEVKYLLTRAMGIEEAVRPDVCEIPFHREDRVVISSDGLSDLVEPEEIRDVVLQNSAADACQILVDMANSRAGHDNITVIILRVKRVKRQGVLSRARARIAGGLIHLLERYV